MGKYRKAPELSRDAREYILSRSDPAAFLIDVMNGEVTEEIRVGKKVVGRKPPSLDQRIGVAKHLHDKVAPNLKSAEVSIDAKVDATNTNVETSLEDLNLSKEERQAMRDIILKRKQNAQDEGSD